jgi:BASS family bile acid:Na+ symporter
MTALPSWLQVLAVAAIFTVMLSLGLVLERDQFAAAFRRRIVLAAIIFGVVVPTPALAVLLLKLLDLSGPVAAGIVLMSVSPGAPIALRRAIEAGGHARFAPALHLAIVLFAIVSVPLSMVIMNLFLKLTFTVRPIDVARQVFLAQLLPIGVGALTRTFQPALAARLRPTVERLGNILLIALLTGCFYVLWSPLVALGWTPALAGAGLTATALVVGAACAGRDREARGPAAVAAAMRNPGLALLIATINQAAGVAAVVFGYALGATVVVTAYVAWRVRTRPSP